MYLQRLWTSTTCVFSSWLQTNLIPNESRNSDWLLKIFSQSELSKMSVAWIYAENLFKGRINVIEIEGLLFPGFGQTQARKFFPSSDVMRALKMELFSWKILSALMCMTSLDGKNRFFSWKVCTPAFAQIPWIANLLFQ